MLRARFALSFDPRIGGVGDEPPRRPAAALLVNIAISEAFPALIVCDQGFAQAFRNANLVALALSAVVGLAVIVLPFRRRDLHGASPKLIRGSWLAYHDRVRSDRRGAFGGTGVNLGADQGSLLKRVHDGVG